jgi:uncharacterized membrane protein
MIKRMKNILDKIYTLVKHVKYIEYIILCLILIGGFGVRLYKLNNPVADWHSWRQSDTAAVSEIYFNKGIDILHPRYYDISSIQSGEYNPHGYRMVEFPFYNVLHALLAKSFELPYVTNSFEAWGRLVSIFCALITIYLLFLIGRRLMGKTGGLLAGFFYAFLPYNIYFTRVILPEPMTIMFAVLSLWLFLRFYDTEKNSWLYLCAVAFAVAMLLKPYMIFYVVPMAALTIQKYGIKSIFRRYSFLIALDIALIPFFLWRIWENNYPVGIPFYKWALNGDEIRFKPSFWRWIFGERIASMILGSWGLVPFALGILRPVSSESRNKDRTRWFIQWFLLGMVLYVSIIATANVKHDYYQMLIIPALCLALASGAIYLWNNKGLNKWLARGLLLFSIFIMFIVGATQIREFYKVIHPEIIEAGKALDAIAPKDALVIAPYNGDTAFLYQTKRKGWPFVDRPIPELIVNGASYWVSVNYSDPQTKEVMEKYTIVQKEPGYVIVDLTKPQ